MNDTWDLSLLYTGFDDPKWDADMKTVDEAVSELNKISEECENTEPEKLIHAYIRASEKLEDKAVKLMSYSQLTLSADTSNSVAGSMANVIMGKISESAGAVTVIKKKIARNGGIEDILREDGTLSDYAYFLRSIPEEEKYLLSDKEEALFAKLNISGADAWENLHSTLTSKVCADYRGEKITLSMVRNLAYDPDPKVRKDAYEAEIACYPQIEDAAAYCLNSIKQQVITECELRGFNDPIDQALFASRMKKETLDALLGAMVDYMPHFRKYMKIKARALGYENGLPFYDLFAPMGSEGDKVYTTQDAKDYLLNIFGKFDMSLHDMVERAFDESWIDFYPREGKVGGAFDHGLSCIKQSRVLTNFGGQFGDIVTLAHELGHAFHDQQTFSRPVITQWYTMPVAETASTFNEVLVMNTAIKEAETKEQKIALIESQLMDANQIICDIYSRFLFEKSVFEARKDEFLSAERMCELMLKAQDESYGDGLDPEYRHKYMWLCKGHYYNGQLSFYNFPYAFGGLFARGLYVKYQEEGPAFIDTYKKMLNATCVCSVEDAAKIAGIDLTDKAFWEKGLKLLSDEIDELEELLK